MLFRAIEKKILEPFIFLFANFFISHESYYKYVMILRYINRKIFNKTLTSTSKHQKKKAKFFIKFKKNSKVLEIGCGELGLGFHLIKYLNNNCYFGADISSIVIKKAKTLINLNPNILKKNPKIFLIYKPKNIISIINNYDTKIFLFSSVFTHLNKNKFYLI